MYIFYPILYFILFNLKIFHFSWSLFLSRSPSLHLVIICSFFLSFFLFFLLTFENYCKRIWKAQTLIVKEVEQLKTLPIKGWRYYLSLITPRRLIKWTKNCFCRRETVYLSWILHNETSPLNTSGTCFSEHELLCQVKRLSVALVPGQREHYLASKEKLGRPL